MWGTIALFAAVAYAAALFLVAAWAERKPRISSASRLRLPAYALGLCVYCTSWTFFGTVGSADKDGFGYLPIYVGPVLVYLIGAKFLERLIRTAQNVGATSIADLIGSRFGKSRGLAALVTLMALLGTIPYLALQLRSVGRSYAAIAGGDTAVMMTATAVVLGFFAILFGTRRYEVSARNDGVLYAVASESVVKSLALILVAGFALLSWTAAPADVRDAGLKVFSARFSPAQFNLDFVVISLLATSAIICLPRQFYMGVIEAAEARDARKAAPAVVGYMIATVLLVLPILLGSLTRLPAGTPPDLFVLALPLSEGANLLALIVFIGGFSAATGMAIVETIALSTMISNDLIAPLLLRNRKLSQGADFSRVMLLARRAAIIFVMSVALAYAMMLAPSERLAPIGLVAFAAIAQFAPLLVMAVLDVRRDAIAAMAGLLVGMIAWAYTLLFPTVADPAVLKALSGGPFSPTALFGLAHPSDITHGVMISLGANLIVHMLVAARRLKRPQFLSLKTLWQLGETRIGAVSNQGQLADMVTRFVGPAAVTDVFGADMAGRSLRRLEPIERRQAEAAERLIAGVIGAPSAHAIMSAALRGDRLKVWDVARLLDETGQSLQFSKGLLAATLENIDPGVSVIDRDLKLIAWNRRYLDLFPYPTGMVQVGTPVADLIRFNALRGECGPGEVEDHVRRRLDHMRKGTHHAFERKRNDGRVIKTVGGPMPDGGYVMCFTDITVEAETREALIDARAELEDRVERRTRQLREANEALERATTEKTRFLAAASHDLLQPLHAARLFSAALNGQVSDKGQGILRHVDASIAAADALLRALLDISKLDAGGIRPELAPIDLRALLTELQETFAPMAAEKGLRVRLVCPDIHVLSDRNLLRSILQNFVSNAVRYTHQGGVLIGVRVRAEAVRIEVYDTGIGIAPEHTGIIFREFERLGVSPEGGIGLGLAIVERTARLLERPLDLRSEPGRGSRFAVTLMRSEAGPAIRPPVVAQATDLTGFKVLVIDDDARVRQATSEMLISWGCLPRVLGAAPATLDDIEGIEAALIDYDIGAGETGLELTARLKIGRPDLRCALITAERDAGVIDECEALGVAVFAKPLNPPDLMNWLASGYSAAVTEGV